MATPLFIDSLPALRAKLARAERDGRRLGQVWGLVRRRAQASPAAFPWFLPFVALLTQAPADLAAARQVVRDYVATLLPLSYSSGLHFHPWCYAFPHARWTLYFQWLDALGAWTADEAAQLRAELLTFQFTNFHAAMRHKPTPECVDNQALSLALSNALVGHLLDGPRGAPSPMAARLRRDSLPRLVDILGGMPASGYSGEGSTYTDHVLGPCLPFLVELLERTMGGEWYQRRVPPQGGSVAALVDMVANEWLPNGLLLPWDHYGYALPARAAIAWGAHRTGDPRYLTLLEEHAQWHYEVNVGWGFDDLVWSLIWWPAHRGRRAARPFASWARADVGAALVSRDAQLYLMQMWDASTPGFPARHHANPNSLVLAAHGSPLTVDGVTTRDCTAFQYDDTWHAGSNVSYTATRANFGVGCAGAHSVLLVDGRESLHARQPGPQAELVEYAPRLASVAADVTAFYRQSWPDTLRVRRRSRLIGEGAWLIEDLAAFATPRTVTSRWWLRPSLLPGTSGVSIETAEGVRLDLCPLLGPAAAATRLVAGYPERLDGAAVCADFSQHGAVCRWLWLARPALTRAMVQDLAADWQVVADPQQVYDLAAARAALAASPLRLPFTLPALMLQPLPPASRWWYRRTVTLPASGPLWLRLPRLMGSPALWVDGQPVDLSEHTLRMKLIAPQVLLPAAPRGMVELIVRTDIGIGHYDRRPGSEGATGFGGQPALLVPVAAPAWSARWQAGRLTLHDGDKVWTVAHPLMAEDAP